MVDIIEQGTADYKKVGGKSRKVDFIALEIAEKGILFDFISYSGAFDEDLARYYFLQFMNGLNFCHEKGICHRDLKPENLLLDKDFNVKIADFGFACGTEGTSAKENGLCKTTLGTELYMAPEIHLGQEYNP